MAATHRQNQTPKGQWKGRAHYFPRGSEVSRYNVVLDIYSVWTLSKQVYQANHPHSRSL